MPRQKVLPIDCAPIDVSYEQAAEAGGGLYEAVIVPGRPNQVLRITQCVLHAENVSSHRFRSGDRDVTGWLTYEWHLPYTGQPYFMTRPEEDLKVVLKGYGAEARVVGGCLTYEIDNV